MPYPASQRRSLLQEARCQTCSLSSLCLPLALELEDMSQFDAIIRRRSPLKKGEPLFRQGDAFTSVYAVRSGSLKQVTSEGNGHDQLTNFFLPSELVGLDGIDEEHYPGTVMALETTTVCEIPNKRRCSVSKFKGRVFVNIREYYEKDGRLLPGAKGAALSAEAAAILVANAEKIDERVRELGE